MEQTEDGVPVAHHRDSSATGSLYGRGTKRGLAGEQAEMTLSEFVQLQQDTSMAEHAADGAAAPDAHTAAAPDAAAAPVAPDAAAAPDATAAAAAAALPLHYPLANQVTAAGLDAQASEFGIQTHQSHQPDASAFNQRFETSSADSD